MMYFDPMMRITCPPGSFAYTVRAGDTLYRIAQQYQTTVNAIVAINPGITPNEIFVGQQICVPGQPPIACPNGTLYVIQQGDTLYTIAQRFNVTLSVLLAANPGIDPNNLRVGQTICIPVQTLTPVSTPCGFLLDPIIDSLPPASAIPIGALLIRRMAMSTWAYTFVGSILPAPGEFGSFDSYIGVLTLYSLEAPNQPERVNIRLFPAGTAPLEQTWAGTSIIAQQPVTQDIAEIFPYNSRTGTTGNVVVLANRFANCRP